jgi:hypothetical protein
MSKLPANVWVSVTFVETAVTGPLTPDTIKLITRGGPYFGGVPFPPSGIAPTPVPANETAAAGVHEGVGVAVGVFVAVEVAVDITVAVAVGVFVGVFVDVAVAVGVFVAVAVGVGVLVGVFDGSTVGVFVGVAPLQLEQTKVVVLTTTSSILTPAAPAAMTLLSVPARHLNLIGCPFAAAGRFAVVVI